MTQNHPQHNLRVRRALEEAFQRTKPFASARLLWERVLTTADREQLGGDVEAAFRKFGTAGMWMQLRGVSANRAILDVAHEVNLLSKADYCWLRREIGEEAAATAPMRPHWNHSEGKLLFGNKLIRRVRINKNPTNIQKIIDAFQAANWSPRIANPLTLGQQQLHQTLRSLNENLMKIAFHALEGGQAIRWECK